MRSEAPNFNRNVYSLLGLTFDAVSLEEAVAQVKSAIEKRTPCFISTPNLNFLIASQRNADFRKSVIHSDLSLADGMPIVWLARLMGIPIPGRVAGSDLFEALRKDSEKRIKVYFFGGAPGIAERAAGQINAERKGMECVGYESPGYGSVGDMSTAATLEKINQSGADFLVVSLGAEKGQAWIEHNLPALEVPVVSHLGAVVNFVAGNVQRAPRWMQKTGMEWLWRVKEEPELWRRYWTDGTAWIKLLISNVIPYFYFTFVERQSALTIIEMRSEFQNPNSINVRLTGDDIVKSGEVIKGHLANGGCEGKSLTIKFVELAVIPADLLALLQIIELYGYAALKIETENIGATALQQLMFAKLEYLQIIKSP